MLDTEIKLSIPFDKVKAYGMDENTTETTLNSLGINWNKNALQSAMDANPMTLTAPSVSASVQFLQHFLPDQIKVVTQARVADELLGRDIAGSWEQEEIVATVKEHIGQARPYGDRTTLNLANWNVNYDRRTIVRFEADLEVGVLEQARSSAMRIDSAGEKRTAVAEALAIAANDVAFNGYNATNTRTYGILNDPYLPGYVTVATGTSGNTEWSTKTFDEIINDFKVSLNALRVRSGSNFDPHRDSFVVGVASSCMEYLDTPNALGTTSVIEWVKKTYPGARFVAVPQFDGANASANVFYVIADTIAGQKVARNYIQDALRMIGMERQSKVFKESYSNAVSGVLVSMPTGVVRYTGI